jgi:hypothetical protein
MNCKMLGIGSILALALAGCGDNNAPTPAATKPTAAATAAAGNAMNAATADVKATADKLLADASQYVKDNKWDLANKTVAELDKSKPNLPAEYGPKIDQVKQLLATAQAATKAAPKMP